MNATEPAGLDIRTRIVLGRDTVDGLGDHARATGARRALLVTDPGVAGAGHADRATRSLEAAGLAVTRFADVHENPTTEDVDACLAAARAADVDLLVGLGGGSSIDTARGCNFLLTSGGRMQDYRGWGKAPAPMLPMIAVPTTTGTGSEMQSYALIADAGTHQKMACGDRKAAAAVAILDPTLSVTQPAEVMACAGMDCVAHALEVAVTRARTDASDLFARESWRLAAAHLPRLLDAPGDLAAHEKMLLASAWAGIAIEHSMLGAAHALANPLTARYDLAHGRAVGMMLPHVMRFNAAEPATRAEYARLARLADERATPSDDDDGCAALVARVETLLRRAGMPATLAACGVTPDALDALAEVAGRQWTARFNPRAVSTDDLRALYAAALSG
ncbi:MAG: iron-containing alcohol dehydrogenase [Planctomycetota bacterium]|jgi:alcohol dehydrogenase